MFEFLGLDPSKVSPQEITAQKYNAAKPAHGRGMDITTKMTDRGKRALCNALLEEHRDLAGMLGAQDMPWKTCGVEMRAPGWAPPAPDA